MTTSGPSGAERRGRSRPALRAALVLLGVVLLLWGGDAAARWAAQSVAERRLQEAAGLVVRPEVHVRGLFFLPQVVAGRYDHVEVDVAEVTQQGLRLSPVHADLYGVRVPARGLVGGTVDRVPVDRTRAQATAGYDDLNRYLAQAGRSLTVSAGADGGARVEGTVTVAGQPVPVAGDVELAVEDGRVRVSAGTGSAGGDPGAGQPLAFTLPLGELPYGQQLEAVRAGPDGIQVETTGTDVVLQR